MKKVQSAKDIINLNQFIERYKNKKNYISEEFQDYGYRIAVKLDDLEHKALYIRLAKQTDRSILDETLEFTLDYPLKHGKRAKIFMWKLTQVLRAKNKKFQFLPVKKKVGKLKPQLNLL